MLRLSVSTGEYILLGDHTKIQFLGGSKNHLNLMIDAPKEVNIVRGSVLEKRMPQKENTHLPDYKVE